MRHVLIATHGRIASGFRSALRLFLNAANDIQVIDAYVEDGDGNYEAKLYEFLDNIGDGEEGYIFTDIKAGSVNQKVIEALSKREKQVVMVTNVNLPVLVGLLVEDGVKSPAEIEAMIEENRPQVIQPDALLEGAAFVTEEDFF